MHVPAAFEVQDLELGCFETISANAVLCSKQDKQKIAAAEPMFALASADLVQTPQPCFHIARHLSSTRWCLLPVVLRCLQPTALA